MFALVESGSITKFFSGNRGITIGDLLIILIIIITSTILIKSFSKDKKTTFNYSNQEQVSYKKNYYQKFIWKLL